MCVRSLLILAGKAKIDEKLLPGQFGVGSVGGVEPPIHLLLKLAAIAALLLMSVPCSGTVS